MLDPAWPDLVADPDSQGKTWIASTIDPSTPPHEPWLRWRAQPRSSLIVALERLSPLLAASGATMLLVPSLRGIVSDIPSVVRLDQECQRLAAANLGILLEPTAMLSADMLALAPDHLARLFALAVLPSVAGVVLSNLRAEAADADPVPCDISEGILVSSWFGPLVTQLRGHESHSPMLRLVVRGEPGKVRAWL